MPEFSLVQFPAHFASAYKPVQWGWLSNRSPLNNVPGEVAFINLIRVATAADVALIGGTLQVGDVYVEHSTVIAGTWIPGQAVQIIGTGTPYDIFHHVLKVVDFTHTVIDAAPEPTDVMGGTIRKFYETYRLISLVTMENIPTPIRRRISSDINGEFILDVRDIAQRSFYDVFEKATPASTDIILGAAGYITQRYGMQVYEGYMIPDQNGINVFTSPEKFNASNSLKHGPDIVVNSVQPYHHIDEDDQSPDLIWENDLAQYEANVFVTAPVARFLTYGPRGSNQATLDFLPQQAQLIGVDEDFYLAFLNAGFEDDAMTLLVSSRDADDNPLQVNMVDFLAPRDSGILTIGYRNILANLDPAAHHYTVALLNENEGFITELFTLEVDRKCYTRPRRFLWLNSFGGIDAYTATGAPEARANDVERELISKPHMAVNFGERPGGDWQRRTFKTTPLRKYRIGTRTERRKLFRYLADDLTESADVRTWIYVRGEDYVWTRLNLLTEAYDMGYKGGRLHLEYFMAVDNVKQFT